MRGIWLSVALGCTGGLVDEDSDTGAAEAPWVVCEGDEDCVDANPCDGTEVCRAGRCEDGEPVDCPHTETCVADAGTAVCRAWCDLPRAPTVAILHVDDALSFVGAVPISVASAPGGEPLENPEFALGDVVGPLSEGPWRVMARSDAPDCANDVFDLAYDVAVAFPGSADDATSRGVPLDDARIAGWADDVHDVTFGDAVTADWRDPFEAVGPAEGASEAVVSLGQGGSITLRFDTPLRNGPGDEFAVFENSFSDTFLELGRVSVSSDGFTFATFDGAARDDAPVDAFGAVDPTTVHGLAGVVRQGFGTPFDLARLEFAEPVRRGFVDLSDIRFVRVDDVVGDGRERDAWGRPIYDPFPTSGSAGFDLDGIAVLAAP